MLAVQVCNTFVDSYAASGKMPSKNNHDCNGFNEEQNIEMLQIIHVLPLAKRVKQLENTVLERAPLSNAAR